MDKQDMLKKLKGFIYAEFGTAKKYAEHKGVTPPFVSSVLKGNKSPTEDMLNDISLNKKVIYIDA